MTLAMTPALAPMWRTAEPDGTLSFSTAAHSRRATLAAEWEEQCLQATEAEAHDQVTYLLTPQRWSPIDYGKRFTGVAT